VLLETRHPRARSRRIWVFGRDNLERAKELVDARTRSIRSVVYRNHYLTTHWPNREILEEARQLTSE